MSVEHADLTGADLHELKGADSASASTVPVADGAGSHTWSLITSASIDDTDLININGYKLLAYIADVSTASSILIPVVEAATLTKATAILSGAISAADATLTFTNSTGPTTVGTLTITQSGSAEGTTFTFNPVSNNSFSANTYLKVATDGGSTDTVVLALLLDFEYN